MRFGLIYEIGMPKPWYESQEAEKYWQVRAQIEDQGTVWWSAGLGKPETVRFVCNVALQTQPSQITCQDFETHAPIDIEGVELEESGSGHWLRHTAASIRFVQAEQRGRSFRWRVSGPTS